MFIRNSGYQTTEGVRKKTGTDRSICIRNLCTFESKCPVVCSKTGGEPTITWKGNILLSNQFLTAFKCLMKVSKRAVRKVFNIYDSHILSGESNSNPWEPITKLPKDCLLLQGNHSF